MYISPREYYDDISRSVFRRRGDFARRTHRNRRRLCFSSTSGPDYVGPVTSAAAGETFAPTTRDADARDTAASRQAGARNPFYTYAYHLKYTYTYTRRRRCRILFSTIMLPHNILYVPCHRACAARGFGSFGEHDNRSRPCDNPIFIRSST